MLKETRWCDSTGLIRKSDLLVDQFVVSSGFVGFVNDKKNTEYHQTYQETPPLSKRDSVVQSITKDICD